MKIFLLVVGGFVLFCGFSGCYYVSKYNKIVTQDEEMGSTWSKVENQYKRRFDLIPSLVKTVRGAADFEQSTLTALTEARASVGKVQLPESIGKDPGKIQAFMKAQAGLGSALSRLLVVSERYPTLKASQNFLSLQDQLEGTENRIAVARKDFIDSVTMYNSTIRGFPSNFIANLHGFERAPQFSVPEEQQQLPEVEFDFKKK